MPLHHFSFFFFLFFFLLFGFLTFSFFQRTSGVHKEQTDTIRRFAPLKWRKSFILCSQNEGRLGRRTLINTSLLLFPKGKCYYVNRVWEGNGEKKQFNQYWCRKLDGGEV